MADLNFVLKYSNQDFLKCHKLHYICEADLDFLHMGTLRLSVSMKQTLHVFIVLHNAYTVKTKHKMKIK